MNDSIDARPGEKLIEPELFYAVTGCAMTVLNTLGHGLREKTYERALCIEFREQGLRVDRQRVFPVFYRGERIDDFVPDLVVENRMIVEIKTVDQIIDEHVGQVINYLRITGLEVGIVLNFKHPRLNSRRVVLQSQD